MNSTSKTLANIGMIGLGVMGQNLTLNIERNGYAVAVFDREPSVRGKFIAETTGKQIVDSSSPEEFVRSLERPRKIILLVKAGDPVDWTINLIKPFLEPGDIIIDGGNSHFKDTERRRTDSTHLGSDCRQSRRRAVRNLHRSRWLGPFPKDGP